MIDDFTSPGRRTPKTIEPLEKPPTTPLPVLEDEPTGSGPIVAKTPIATPLTDETSIVAEGETELTDLQAAGGFAGGKSRRFHMSWPPTKRQKIIGSVCAVLLAFGLGASYTHFHHTKAAVADVVKPTVKKVIPPKPIYSTLTGLPVADASVNLRPVTAVMIENSPDARPQSGLDQAGVVFEALAEGGVTRFMALFQDTQPSYIGPVRSARPYYVQWALSFDAGYAHVGGSPDGLADIKAWSVHDLDQFYNSGAYQRVSSRYAPHNVYTSIANLNKVEQAKGYNSSTFTGFARKADAASKAPNATSIDLTFSGYYYNSHFDYDAATNSYKRSETGAPHMEVDASGKSTQISPKVVIAMTVPMSRGALDASGAYYSNYNPLGSGPITVFQDGVATAGSWNKATNTSPLTFTDANGQPLPLNAGQTWISAITGTNNVAYK